MVNSLKIKVTFYGWCQVTDRETVLSDLDYQYEGTEIGLSVPGRYDVYSNSDGDYFAVKEDE